MKICVISFDFWQYDQHIVQALQARGIEAAHINIGAYRHASLAARIKNAFSKIFLGKNLKNIRRQEMMMAQLAKLGIQDQILVINPELIDRNYHLEIKKFAKRYIAYLYDSLARCPAEHLIELFDGVFSFDKEDCKKFGFQEITNYNYLPESTENQSLELDLIYIGSFDNRFPKLYDIAKSLDIWQKKYKFYIIGKKSWKKALEGNKNFIFGTKRIPHRKIPKLYQKSKVVMDLARDGQSGLSFRFFEAMALKKKVITDNATVKDYDFYNPQNILVLGEKPLMKEFFETDYQELPKEIYQKYTVGSWVDRVFNLMSIVQQSK